MEAGQCKPDHRYRKSSPKFVSKLIRRSEHKCPGIGLHSWRYNILRKSDLEHKCICASTFSRVRRGLPDDDTPVLHVSASNALPSMLQAPSTVTTIELSELLALNKKDLVPDWNLAKFTGNLLQWHEWYGLFKSGIDWQALIDDIKLLFVKKFRDALNTL